MKCHCMVARIMQKPSLQLSALSTVDGASRIAIRKERAPSGVDFDFVSSIITSVLKAFFAEAESAVLDQLFMVVTPDLWAFMRFYDVPAACLLIGSSCWT